MLQAKAVAGAEAVTELRNKKVSMRPKLGRPSLQQYTFDWSATDKYTELRNFRLEVKIYISDL